MYEQSQTMLEARLAAHRQAQPTAAKIEGVVRSVISTMRGDLSAHETTLLAEVEELERSISAAWTQATRGHEDEGSLMTVFLTLAAGSKPSTLLTEKQAATLIRKIRKTGLDAQLTADFIRSHAPPDFRDDYLAIWDVFVEDALPTLRSDLDYALNDALALLRRECNVSAGA